MLTRNVLVLGLASLFNDAASELVVPLLPVFLHQLGGGAVAVGAMEGLAELVASLLKLWSGRASDRRGRAVPFVLSGYGLAALSRPFLALASSPVHVVLVRAVDRVGKGLRTAPRDALLASSVSEEHRGAAFGFHRSMDHAGAMIGPALALALLTFVTTDLRVLFLVASIPGALAALVLFLAREVPKEPKEPPPLAFELGQALLLAPFVVGALGALADAFLMLAVGVDAHAPLVALPVIWILLHLVRSALSTPAGWLADRWPGQRIVALGYAARAVTAVLLGLVADPKLAAAVVVFSGVGAITEGAEKKLVSARLGGTGQGSAFGLYHVLVGLAGMTGALVIGTLWDEIGSGVAFAWCAGLSAVAAVWVAVAGGAPRKPA
ncbi:MAG: MFS transporter [Alphaproteobacteria bacterium]|nr:MFS transporter [Alphaproteobacteria bacterium]